MGIFDAPPSIAHYVPLAVIVNTLLQIPIASLLARPNGIVSHTLAPLLNHAKTDFQRIVSITAFFFFMTYTFSASLSLTGAALGNPEGYRNDEPRLVKDRLTGLAHRLTALHDNLLEIFPAFIVCAAITLALPHYGADPRLMEKCINFLLLTTFAKTILYIPAYAAGYGTLRSLAHLLAMGSLLGLLINVASTSSYA